MLEIAGGIILAVLFFWLFRALFAALARPIFKVLTYLIGLYALIMGAGFAMWGLMAAFDYLAPLGGYGLLIGVMACIVAVLSPNAYLLNCGGEDI
jgi:hypothetical protein